MDIFQGAGFTVMIEPFSSMAKFQKFLIIKLTVSNLKDQLLTVGPKFLMIIIPFPPVCQFDVEVILISKFNFDKGVGNDPV